ncbi:hypothetical protein A2U01_0081126, partial [Trifolium medium]|nr:hypothetical protein [Trifolium medium]
NLGGLNSTSDSGVFHDENFGSLVNGNDLGYGAFPPGTFGGFNGDNDH